MRVFVASTVVVPISMLKDMLRRLPDQVREVHCFTEANDDTVVIPGNKVGVLAWCGSDLMQLNADRMLDPDGGISCRQWREAWDGKRERMPKRTLGILADTFDGARAQHVVRHDQKHMIQGTNVAKAALSLGMRPVWYGAGSWHRVGERVAHGLLSAKPDMVVQLLYKEAFKATPSEPLLSQALRSPLFGCAVGLGIHAKSYLATTDNFRSAKLPVEEGPEVPALSTRQRQRLVWAPLVTERHMVTRTRWNTERGEV